MRVSFLLLAAILSTTLLTDQGLGRPQDKSNAPPELPSTPAGNVFAEWLSVFNSGDAERIGKFQADHSDPGHHNVQRDLDLRERTGGFELKRIETSTTTEITAVVKEKNSTNLARVTLETSFADPTRITNFGLRLIPGAEPVDSVPIAAPESLSELIQEVDSKLTRLEADDKFSGAVLIAKDGKVSWQKAYGYADLDAKIPNTGRDSISPGLDEQDVYLCCHRTTGTTGQIEIH